MDDKLDKIKDDVNDIKVALTKIDSTLERNTDSLQEHMKRSDNLEAQTQIFKSEITPLLPEIRTMLKYWRILSVLVIIAVTSANPALFPIIMKFFGMP